MTPIDKAEAILAGTNDGNELTALDLALTQAAANDSLNEVGLQQLDNLYEEVTTGVYDRTRQFLCGVQNLTRDAEGYVYWRGKHVEHYSHSNLEDLTRDAEALAARCLALEAKGFPVTSRTAIYPIYEDAPAGTPWLDGLQRFYALFEGLGRHVAIFYRHGIDRIAVLERDKGTGELNQRNMSSAYDAFHFVQNQGLTCVHPVDKFQPFVDFFAAAGISSDDVNRALA